MSEIHLSDKQKEIVEFDKGALLVLASAGSGKTRVLTERIKQLLNKTIRKILAITFTNKASEEIKERLPMNEDKLFVGTFHSFCIYVLQHHGSAVGFKSLPQIYSEAEDRLKMIEVAISEIPSIHQQYIRSTQKEQNDYKYKVLEMISQQKRNAVLEVDEIQNEELRVLYMHYIDCMYADNVIDFDDLLLLTYKLFVYNPRIAALYRRNFEYICIDEAQDLNKAQYMLLRALTGDEHKNVMMVGDSNQSIYGFNGSSSQYMLRLFKDDYATVTFRLTENYRSSRKVLELANKIVENSSNTDEFVLEGICETKSFDTVEEESSWVADRIVELLSAAGLSDIEGRLTEDRIAILARNKYLFLPIEKELERRNIQYYYKGSVGGVVFDSISGKVFYLALQVRVNSKDHLHFAQLSKLVGIDASNSLEELRRDCVDPLLKEVLDIVLSLTDVGDNFYYLMDKAIEMIQDRTSLKSIDENELNLSYNDMNEIRNHWSFYCKNNKNRSLGAFRNAMALGQTLQNAKEQGVALSTVHTMKGQESDVVFLIGMDNETFPDYRSLRKGDGEMVQEKNNLYVAVTRARRYLYITYPTCRKMPWGDVKKRERSSLLRNL